MLADNNIFDIQIGVVFVDHILLLYIAAINDLSILTSLATRFHVDV